MKSKRVIAEIIDPCQCRHFTLGEKIVVNSHKPDQLCESAYLELKRQAEGFESYPGIMQIGGGKIVTKCPHFDGAVWELRLEDKAE